MIFFIFEVWIEMQRTQNHQNPPKMDAPTASDCKDQRISIILLSWGAYDWKLGPIGIPVLGCFEISDFQSSVPIGSMYGIRTCIWLIFMVNVGKYTSPMDPMGLGWITSPPSNPRWHPVFLSPNRPDIRHLSDSPKPWLWMLYILPSYLGIIYYNKPSFRVPDESIMECQVLNAPQKAGSRGNSPVGVTINFSWSHFFEATGEPKNTARERWFSTLFKGLILRFHVRFRGSIFFN